MISRELTVEIRQSDVLRQIGCNEDSELYKEVLAEFKEIETQMYELCEPVFLMEYGEIGPELANAAIPEGTPVLMVITSIGRGISEYATKCFAEGDYLKGMLADAMADSALFSLEKEIVPYLREECGVRRMGIRRRLEAPQDISIEAQKVVFDLTGAAEKCGMGISSGYMLDPVKSNGAIYLLTDDQELFMHQHNCRKCSQLDCKGRNIPDIPVKVLDGETTYSIMVKEKESILDVLIARDIDVSAVCGGTGRCGKCRIRILNGYLPASASDRACFTEKEIEAGMRLACKAYPAEPLQIDLQFKNESAFEVLSDFNRDADIAKVAVPAKEITGKDKSTLCIAVDIGTTTIAIQLIQYSTGNKLATYTSINHQRSFGADVISRITASTQGKKEALKKLIQKDLSKGIRKVVQKACVCPEQVKEVAIAGNTTMIHLLMGYDCKGLGEFPFTPVNIKPITGNYSAIIGDDFLAATVYIFPGISAFVGGDVVSGLYAYDFDVKDEYSLLIDLGTNGEIALGNREKIMVTSTAAGPAFEGGNITFGVGSIEGAISGVRIDNQGTCIQTIAGKAPVGICGTGVIEAVSELVKAELIDDTGCLCDEHFDEGYPLAKSENGTLIRLTQSDIREIQLAKAAVRAGVETLLLRYGILEEDISHVYLAGGFGYKLDCDKAMQIGMLPKSFAGKIESIGNGALAGAVKFLKEESTRDRTAAIGCRSREINLSADKDFNQKYMEAMYFEEM